MNYYISDLHLFHKNVTDEGSNFDNRPFKTLDEMHKIIREKWNERITGADHIYILGDLAWKENEETISFVSTLRGNKHLIIGNHDRIKDQRYKQLFVEVVDYKETKDIVDGREYYVVMSHFPLAFWNYQHRYRRDEEEYRKWSVHLYGHVHNSVEQKYYQDFIHELNNKHDIKCVAKNVGCMLDYMNYTPRTLEEIIKGCDENPEFFRKDPHLLRKLEIEFNLSHVNRKLLYDLLYGKISNNYRKMHGCTVIRQRAYDKNYNNKRKV